MASMILQNLIHTIRPHRMLFETRVQTATQCVEGTQVAPGPVPVRPELPCDGGLEPWGYIASRRSR